MTDVFPIAVNTRYSYTFYRRWTEAWSTKSGFIDSGSITCIIRDSTASGDTMTVWRVEQRRDNWHWNWRAEVGNIDSPRLVRDTTMVVLEEMRSGDHEIRVSGAAWSFPVTGVDGDQRPVYRFADSASVALVVTSGGGAAYSEDTVFFKEDEGLTRHSYSGWYDSIPWDSYFGYTALLEPPTALDPRTSGIPVTLLLEQNYPNPFNPATTIRYALPVRSYVRLTVYNTLGQVVSVLVSESEDAGYHEARFNGMNAASGVYFYRIESGAVTKTMKLVLLR